MATVERAFTNLNANTKYLFRVRSLNGLGVYSGWSESFAATTGASGTGSPIGPPTGLTIDFTTPNIILNWSPPVDTIGVIQYEIKFTVGAVTKTYYSLTPSYIYFFNQNVLDFGSPQPVVHVSVATIDIGGFVSAATTGVATNAIPSTPPNPTAVAAFTVIIITMFQPADMHDFLQFILETSTDNTTWTSLVTTTQTSYAQAVGQGTTHYYRYKVVDVFSQVSVSYSGVASATSLSTPSADTVPPAIPTGLAVVAGVDNTTQVPFADVSWNAVTTNADSSPIFDLDHYELRFTQTSAPAWPNFSFQIVGPQSTTYRFLGLSQDATYQIAIAAYDQTGNGSGFSTVVTFSTGHSLVPPPVPSSVTTYSEADSILLLWTPNPDFEFLNYELYGSTTPGFTPGVPSLLYTGSGAVFVMLGNPGDVWYFRIRALDVFGNASGYSSQVTGTVGTAGSASATQINMNNGVIGGTTIAGNTLIGGNIIGANFQISSGVNSGVKFLGSGSITWVAGATGGITVSNSGFIQSANFDSTHGWSLGPSGLIINQGVISAAAIQIGVSGVNYVTNSSFENPFNAPSGTPYVAMPTGWSAAIVGGHNSYTLLDDGTSVLFGRQSVVMTTDSGTPSNTIMGLFQDITLPNPVNTNLFLTISFWALGKVVNATHPTLYARVFTPSGGTATTLWDAPAGQTLPLGTWQRYTGTFQIVSPLASVRIFIGAMCTGANAIAFDGVQFQTSSYATDYAPAPLEIPDSYIQSAYISNLDVDRITAGLGILSNLVIQSAGHITSANSTGSTGYQLSSTGAVFQNAGISLVGAGGALTLDSSSLRAVYGGNTKFQVDSTGVYIGGNTTSNAQVYFNTSSGKTVFQSPGGAGLYTLSIDLSTSAPSGKVMELSIAGTDNFYLTNAGVMYVKGGLIDTGTITFGTITAAHIIGGTITGTTLQIGTSTAFSVDVNGNMWIGAATLAAAPFSVNSTGSVIATAITVTGGAINGSFINGTTITGGTITGADISATSGASTIELLSGVLYFKSASFGTVLGTIVADQTGLPGSLNSSSMTLSGFGGSSTVVLNASGIVSLNATQSVIVLAPQVIFGAGRTSFFTTGGAGTSLLDIYNSGGFTEIDVRSNLPGGSGGAALQIANGSPFQILKTISSARYKEGIVDLDVGEGNPIFKMQPRRFSWREDVRKRSGIPEGATEAGLIAEEVAEICREMVVFDQNGLPEALQTNPLLSYIVAAVNHLKTRIDGIEFGPEEATPSK